VRRQISAENRTVLYTVKYKFTIFSGTDSLKHVFFFVKKCKNTISADEDNNFSPLSSWIHDDMVVC
jgi:hypothetical protein